MNKLFLLISLTFLLICCSPQKKPIEFGKDNCEHCEMTISESKWGAEIVTKKGKVYKFDSIECLVAYLNSKNGQDASEFNSLWTVDYNNPGELIDAEKAIYLKSSAFHSPMGLNIASFSKESDMVKYKNNDSAQVLNWNGVIQTVKQKWML